MQHEDIADLRKIFKDVENARQIAEARKLDLLAYLLRMAECEVVELLCRNPNPGLNPCTQDCL